MAPKLAIALGCLVLLAFREPHLLAVPRLWAEEGKIFLAFALQHPAWEVFITPQVGYLTLFNSLVGVLQARFFPIEAAAIVSTSAGFLVQLLPVGLILFTNHPFWSTNAQKAVCALIVVLVTPHELWLNTTNAHFFFGLTTFLILVIPATNLPAAGRWLLRGLLVLGTLSGPAAMLLTPAFLLKAYAERSREKTLQAAIQVCCAVLQAGVTLYSLSHDNRYHRFQAQDAGITLRNFVIDHFSMNIAGYGVTVALAIAIPMAAYVAFLFVRHRRSLEPLVFLLAFACVAVFSTLGSINALGSPRYGYVPTCILMLLIAGEAFSLRGGRTYPAQLLAAMILAAGLALNAASFRARMGEIHSPDIPAWPQEVAKWRADPAYKPRIHPQPWVVELQAPGRQEP